ncbi:hypothetical protein GOAMR_11_00340 [Gordonia amarae NBRC 15530]|uniref:Uncharacterized protein n=1 Tax=Gordonia amarae NBRC 15530 TaxID=1075090 RepID=G7GKE9_9ACTN|nr:hypothetical protein GOAMR_11_00340 [Gordonia amarae NBRC 15530]
MGSQVGAKWAPRGWAHGVGMNLALLSCPAVQIARRLVVIAATCTLMLLAAYQPTLLP